jgi:phosphoribosylglycinamide formyltransferase-1
VISNRRGSAALEIARRAGVPAAVMPQSDFGDDSAARDRAMLQRLRAADVELVVCAGYDRILSDEFLAAFPDAIVNVHPSLLPAFAGGMDAVEQAIAHGVKITGCTVQLLEPGDADGGAIILQAAVPVESDDDAETLRLRIHQQEWTLLPLAVELWATGRLHRHGRHVRVEENPAAGITLAEGSG